MAITFIDNQPIRFNSAKFDDQSCINKDLSGYSVLMQPGDPLNFQAKQYCCGDNLACDADELGAELVTDGDMSNAGSWTATGGWVVGGGLATLTAAGVDGQLSQTGLAISVGQQYRVQVNVISNTTGYIIDVYLGGRRIGQIEPNATGIHNLYGVAGTQTSIGINASNDYSVVSSGIIVIDDVSAKQMASCYTFDTNISQRITNGDFASASGWGTDADWTIAAGLATHTTPAGLGDVYQQINLAHREDFTFTFTISGRTAGSVDVVYGNTVMANYSANATHTFNYPVYGLTDLFVRFTAVGGFDGSIDNVSVTSTRSGWSYDPVGGFCHEVAIGVEGRTNAFYAGNTLTIGDYYQMLVEVIMTSGGSVLIEAGGVQLGTITESGRYSFYFTALTTAGEKFTPTSDFDGCIMPDISLCQFRKDYEMRLVYEDGTGATDWHTSSSSQDPIVYTDEWVTWKVTSLSSVLSGGIPVELPYSCFKVELRDFCYNGVEDSFQYSSDTTINYKANHPCTKRIRAWSGGIASGFNFGTNGTLFKLIERFETLYFNPTYPNSGEDYEYSTGTLKRIFSKTEKRYELLFNYMDEYAHDTMSVMVVCDIFEMDGVEYLVPFKDYEPQWHERGKRNLAQSTIEIQKRIEKVLINKNCA